ncbi:hypothetical protein VHEMI07159 [[Torrubiella] hemipterigena]|uniref:Methyltransferase type 12 n=1 Tax=[Torrubiella] hemipterigena TaxID=1531966 RepID=A0A0A1T9G9_9HYPO|nr:hypothetical protein VHEMI07159 [[Torrubiella] hemipterigena]
MTRDSHIPLTKSTKTDFHDVYNQLDPRAYYAALEPFSYQTPQNASALVGSLIDASGCRHGSGRLVLDVCCSYGINSALQSRSLTYDDLTRHYAASKIPPKEQAAADRLFFDAQIDSPVADILGLDTATNAIQYAKTAGLIVNGWDENLELGPPSDTLQRALKHVGLVICTGGYAYVANSTFDRIVSCVEDRQTLWIMVSVLRTFSFDSTAKKLEKYGLVTEKIPGARFRQRRFTSVEEQDAAIHDVLARGLDPTGFEADGWYYTECYLCRSLDEVERVPIEEIVIDRLAAI